MPRLSQSQQQKQQQQKTWPCIKGTAAGLVCWLLRALRQFRPDYLLTSSSLDARESIDRLFFPLRQMDEKDESYFPSF